jgi:hypothetical protein
MTVRRNVVIDDSAPLWAKQLETELNGALAGLSSDIAASIVVPVGSIVDYSGATLPPKFLWPNGQAVSRRTYALLFAAIGTTYGAGDGSTTFNLPNVAAGTVLKILYAGG